MNFLRCLEILIATSLMVSKYFLAISSVWGWWLSILGYTLLIFFNIKIKLRITVVIVSELVILSVYGLYKWSNQILGFQKIDYAIIFLSIIVSLMIIIVEGKRKKPFWVVQSITTILFSIAFIMLGMKIELGWYALLAGHVNNSYLYHKNGAYFIAITQIISIVVVVVRLI